MRKLKKKVCTNEKQGQKKITESLFVYKCNIRAYKKADFVFENSTNCCERERENETDVMP